MLLSMNNMFKDANIFNQPIDNWDVSNTDMEECSLMNPLNNWDVSNVTDMEECLEILL